MRYAIYYAPPASSPLHRLGSHWLGRDAVTGESMPQIAVEGLREATAEPARYGLHATLKPPFHLAAGKHRVDLGDAVNALAGSLEPVVFGPLALRDMDGFLALVPERDSDDLDALAAACVRSLDVFRAPPDAEELDRRSAAGLSPRQEQYLRNWGYPYVLDEFRFHITLTGRIPEADRRRLMHEAQRHFAPVIGKSCVVDCLSVFGEGRPGQGFVVEERFRIAQSLQLRTGS